MTTERCAEYWRLLEAARESYRASGGRKTSASQQAIDSLENHFAACPECRAWFDLIPVEGKATAEITPDL